MTGKIETETPGFLERLGEELFDMNARSFVRDVDLMLLPQDEPVEPHTKFTPDIALGFVEGTGLNPAAFLSNDKGALCFSPDDSIAGANWVSFEMPVLPSRAKCAFVIRIAMEVDRTVYPEVFVRNTHTGEQFKPGKVAVLSPKASDMFLIINLDNEVADNPHMFTMIFTSGSFNLKISSINYVSM